MEVTLDYDKFQKMKSVIDHLNSVSKIEVDSDGSIMLVLNKYKLISIFLEGIKEVADSEQVDFDEKKIKVKMA